MNIHYEKLGRRLQLIVPNSRPDPVSRLLDIPEKVYSTELKPIVGTTYNLLRTTYKLLLTPTTSTYYLHLYLPVPPTNYTYHLHLPLTHKPTTYELLPSTYLL